MNGVGAYWTMIEQVSSLLRRSVDEIDSADFGRRPGDHLNPTSFIFFHVLRHWDRDINWVCKGQGPNNDLWQRAGIGQQMGYDPRGHGLRGVGTGIGYSDSEVDDVPANRVVLGAYHDLLLAETREFIDDLGDADRNAGITNEHFPGPTYTIDERLRHLILHTAYHTGDIAYAKGMLGQPDPTYWGAS